MNIRYFYLLILTVLLAAGILACSGGGSNDPVNPGPQANGGGTTLTGRILDREGHPAGNPWAEVTLTVKNGGTISPTQQPANSGPDAGIFKFVGLPTGTPLILEIGLFQVSMGRNLGYIHELTLTTGGTFDLGDIVLENDFLDNGWNSYVAKDYDLAIINFNRAFEDRFIQSNLSYSSSAYTGLGWVYAKRGKCMYPGLYYTDPDTGEWLDTINPYEWDTALTNFERALSNPNDSDAWVGKAGTLLTLVGQSSKDPVVIGTQIPFYAFISYYFDDAQQALDKALLVDPDYNCAHDEISANDLRATELFLRWIQGQTVSIAEVETLKGANDLNQGSLQLLEVLPDLIKYNPFPQL